MDTRRQLINAATAVMAERGYSGASTKAVADAAGVTHGLVHYHFGSKLGLLMAVVTEAHRRTAEEVAAVRDAVGPGAARLALQAASHRAHQRPEVFRLRYELFAVALREPEVAPAVARLLAEARGGIGTTIEHSQPSPPVATAELAAIALAVFDGLALQQLVDPDFDSDAVFAAFGRLTGVVAE
ncbi:MAG: TetR/AcrR family transcriptional regulator [Kineosporiaceae bacterium]